MSKPNCPNCPPGRNCESGDYYIGDVQVSGADPACVVHQGRKARGPKPPPVGDGICDGSGRTCPRHGAAI